jgi:hypothetical protein
MVRSARLLPILLLAGLPAGALGDDDQSPVIREARPLGESVEDEAPDLRQRLTERNDKRAELEPWRTEIGGSTLSIGGQYELAVDRIRHLTQDIETGDRYSTFLGQELEVEGFLRFDQQSSLFAQARLVLLDDRPADDDELLATYAERGEMWFRQEQIADSDWAFGLGRIDYEDERHWWWDEELDSVLIVRKGESTEFSLALAKELGPVRSNQDQIDPDQKDVWRLLAALDWKWGPNQSLQLFALRQDDRSQRSRPGDLVATESEDPSDADLTWLGGRLIGIFELPTAGLLGYWLDAAWVRGTERLAEFEEESERVSVVESVRRADVSGWGFDSGVNWQPDLAWEPRFYAGFAYGSGKDRGFRQTGLESNESGFGGVEEFPNYGILLDPELSNLRISTLGTGIALFESSSLDLVYHHYRLAEPADALRDSAMTAELNGTDRALGDALDLVLAVEEWDRLELLFTLSAFRAGRAFGDDHGKTSYGGFAGLRVTF